MITNHNSFHRTLVSRRKVLATSAAGIATTMALTPGSNILATQDGETDDSSQVLRLPLYPYGELVLLDPHRATNWGHHWVLLPHVWAGLLRFDELGAVVTDLASSIEPEDGGLAWVATIRSDAAFASGNPVTADALVQSWFRALDSQQLAPMASFMSRVQGYEAFVAGESEEIGFEVRDEMTVAIRLAEPYAHFPEDLAAFIWAAVDVAALEGVPGSEVPFADASAGLWRFVVSDDDTLVRMVRNPNSPDGAPDGFGEVHWRVYSGNQATENALNAFQNGELAIADVTGPVAGVVEQDEALAGQLQTISSPGSTMLIGMDFTQAPFDDIRVRQAVAASIDASAWASDIMGGDFIQASSITAPVLMESANYSAPDLIAFDPERARSLIAEAGIDEQNQPVITYYHAADAPDDNREQAEALLEMIRINSGLVVELNDTLTAEQIESFRSDNGGLQFALRWWWPFSNSPSSLISLAAPESDAMTGWFNWSSELDDEAASAAAETFEALMSDVVTNVDATERVQIYAEAEQILAQNAVFIPLGHWVQSFLLSPALAGTRQGPFTGYAPVVLDSDVTFQPPE